MLKRELVQHMRRLWRVLLAILLTYLIVSAIIMQRIASNISSLRDMDTWIKFLPFSYSLFYGITIAFLVILFFFYTLRTIAVVEKQDGCCWHTQKKRAYLLMLCYLQLSLSYSISLASLFYIFPSSIIYSCWITASYMCPKNIDPFLHFWQFKMHILCYIRHHFHHSQSYSACFCLLLQAQPLLFTS